MSTQRDELAREIHSTEQLGCGCCTDYNYTREQDQHADNLDVNPIAVAIGDTLLAAGYRKPRTITTAEELDALAADSVVMDVVGDVARKQGRDEWLCNGRNESESNYWFQLPATVLYEPTA